MKKIVLPVTLLLVFAALAALAQPPHGKRGGPPRGPGGPPRYELGKVLPPHVRDELQLSREQEEEIAKLEAEVKQRLSKILSAEQKRKLENLRPPGPPGGPPPGDPPPGAQPPDGNENVGASLGGGIQWFATWEGGLAEAKRTGRPILLVSAAPHCAGVSGIW